MTVTAVFAVRVAHNARLGDVYLDGFGLDALVRVDPGRLRADDPLQGRVVLFAPGQPACVLDDDAEELVGAACFQAPVELAAGRAHSWFVNGAPAEVHMTPVNDRDAASAGGLAGSVPGALVRVTGTVVEPFEAPAAELLPALVDCGVRAVGLLRRIAPDDDQLQARLHDLDVWARDATAALGRT